MPRGRGPESVGTPYAGDPHGRAESVAADAKLRDALLEHFKPEFVNRLDDIVRFTAAEAGADLGRSWSCRSSA